MNAPLAPLTPSLPVMEAFYTLQGEGYHQGSAAYFIRLGGCDVGCHWCDVKESWDAARHPRLSLETILQQAVDAGPGRLAVITGGEPLMHPLDLLTETLRQAGFRTHLETSGAHPLSGTWDWICLSPKKFKPVLSEVLQQADELKVVIYHPSDIAWAESFVPQLKPGCRLYLQPEWSRAESIIPLLVRQVLEHPEWRISLQTHKYMQIP